VSHKHLRTDTYVPIHERAQQISRGRAERISRYSSKTTSRGSSNLLACHSAHFAHPLNIIRLHRPRSKLSTQGRIGYFVSSSKMNPRTMRTLAPAQGGVRPDS
jgi:hypothetical protein